MHGIPKQTKLKNKQTKQTTKKPNRAHRYREQFGSCQAGGKGESENSYGVKWKKRVKKYKLQ